MNDLRLYLVTDHILSLGRDITWIVQEAVIGGVTMVQIREKDSSTRHLIELSMHVQQILTPYRVPLIINDRVDVALAVNASGVHIGQSDMPYEMARKLMGRDKIIGLSVESMEQVLEANNLDVDYIGISPVFSTATKTNTSEPFGLEGTRHVMELTKHPAVGIGGINRENAFSVIQAGVTGIAVVSAICSANDPRKAARDLRKLVEKMQQ